MREKRKLESSTKLFFIKLRCVFSLSSQVNSQMLDDLIKVIRHYHYTCSYTADIVTYTVISDILIRKSVESISYPCTKLSGGGRGGNERQISSILQMEVSVPAPGFEP